MRLFYQRLVFCTVLLCNTVVFASNLDSAAEVIDDSHDSEAVVENKGQWVPVPLIVSNPTVGTGLQAMLMYLHPKKSDATHNATSGIVGMYTDTNSWFTGIFHDDYWQNDTIRFSGFIGSSFKVPKWDTASLLKIRNALAALASTVSDTKDFFGDKSKLDRLNFLMGTAAGWGGNPKEGAVYFSHSPEKNDGVTPYTVTVKDVPTDGFWSITVYGEDNYLKPNKLGRNALNNVTAKKNKDGSITINAGGCEDGRINCIPITKGWNYVARTYRPRPEIVSGKWVFPEMKPGK